MVVTNKCLDKHVRTHYIIDFFVCTLQDVDLLMMLLIYGFAYICVFCVRCSAPFKQHKTLGRTKLKRKKGTKKKDVSI